MNQPDPTTDRLERAAAAIWALYSDAEPSRTGLVMANPHTVADAVLADADTEQTAALSRAVAAILTDAGLRDAEGEHALAAYGRELARLIQPDGQSACPDPIQCSHEAALGEAQEQTRRAKALLLRTADLVSERASDLWAPGTVAHAEMLADAQELRSMADEQPPVAPVVPPAPTSRAAHLLEAADIIEAAQHERDDLVNDALGFLDNNTEQQHVGVHRAAQVLRRLAAVPAAEEQPETPAEALLDIVHATATAWARPSMSEPSRIAGRHLLAILDRAEAQPGGATFVAAPDLGANEARGSVAVSPDPAEEQPDNETPGGLKRAHVALAEQAGRDQAVLARVGEWVTSDVVTARNEFGNGYREAQRDIRDLLGGTPLSAVDTPPVVVPQPEDA